MSMQFLILVLNIHADLVTTNELVSGSYSEVAVWDLENGQLQRYLAGHRNQFLDADWSEDGGLITVAGDSRGIIWDFERRIPREILQGQQGEVCTVAWAEG